MSYCFGHSWKDADWLGYILSSWKRFQLEFFKMDERNFTVELSAIQLPCKIKAQAPAEWVMMRHVCNMFTLGISWISFIHLLKLNDNLTLFNHTKNSSALSDCSRLLCAHNLKLSDANFKCTYISANCVHTATERWRRCRRYVFNRSCWTKAVKIKQHTMNETALCLLLIVSCFLPRRCVWL